MNRERQALILLIIMSIFSSGVFFSSCGGELMEGTVILTLTKDKIQKNRDWDSCRYTIRAKIVALNHDKTGGTIIPLTDKYFSAMSPSTSFDGRYLLFNAQIKQNDPWQIFEMNLKSRKVRQITDLKENCFDPAYLPNGRLVFRMINNNNSPKSGQPLYSCKIDGSDLKQITFNPHSYSFLTVLKDGRIFAVSRQLYPEKGDQQFIAMRPDGTKAELFYKGTIGSNLQSRGYETRSGKLAFVESERNSSETNVIFINYNRPLHSRVNLTEGKKGDFHSVFPMTSGNLMISWRPAESERFGLFEFNPLNKTFGEAIYKSNDYDVLEALTAESHERPKKLPSEVDMGVRTGLLLCQDVNILDPESAHCSPALSKATSIQVMGKDSSLGIVPIAKDGSFYLKVIADQPFQIRVLDDKGTVLDHACSWIWLRPNERRGCVGCHEDHEQVPENRVPLAVKTSPVSIPVHITKINEKKVELE